MIIPKPSKSFGGVLIVFTEKTGDYNSASDLNYIDVINVEGYQLVQRKSVSRNGVIDFRLPEGTYSLESYYMPNQEQRVALSIVPSKVEIHRVRVLLHEYKMGENFDRIGSKSFSQSTNWFETSQPKRQELLATLQNEKNSVFWEIE